MSDEEASQPLVGVFWMVVTGICFVAVTALVKYMGTRVPAPQAAFLRYIIGIALLAPFFWRAGIFRMDGKLLAMFAGRGMAHTVGVALWFFAMARIPIADVTAMNYLSPIYVTLGAALFLGERLALRRVMAIVIAMLGALIILRPGFRVLESGHLAMLIAAVFFGASYLTAKELTRHCSAGLVVLILSISVTIGLAPLAIYQWVALTWHELLVLFAVACVATAGHYTMTLAFRAAPLAVTQPLTFLQLVWAVILGAAVFNEGVDVFVVAGGLVIVASVTFMSWREAMLKRRAITPASYATKV